MKRVKRTIGLCIILASMFLQSTMVFASESVFVEIPNSQISVQDSCEQDGPSLLVEPSLASCDLGVGASGNGVSVTFTTRATMSASEIGVRNVVLQEKTLFGWKDIPISDHSTTNSDYYNGGVVYTQAVAGKTYRASCTHYAVINGREYTLSNQTNELVYN